MRAESITAHLSSMERYLSHPIGSRHLAFLPFRRLRASPRRLRALLRETRLHFPGPRPERRRLALTAAR